MIQKIQELLKKYRFGPIEPEPVEHDAAYECGYTDYLKIVHENPYLPGTTQHRSWERGQIVARQLDTCAQ